MPTPRVLDRPEACPRRALKAIVDASPYSYAELSRMIGRQPQYLATLVREGRPATLTGIEHRHLAHFFRLDYRALGVRELWRPIAA